MNNREQATGAAMARRQLLDGEQMGEEALIVEQRIGQKHVVGLVQTVGIAREGVGGGTEQLLHRPGASAAFLVGDPSGGETAVFHDGNKVGKFMPTRFVLLVGVEGEHGLGGGDGGIGGTDGISEDGQLFLRMELVQLRGGGQGVAVAVHRGRACTFAQNEYDVDRLGDAGVEVAGDGLGGGGVHVFSLGGEDFAQAVGAH